METLLNLASNLKKCNDLKSTEKYFLNFSKDFLNTYTLKIGNNYYELVEIEFYYFECNKHEDIYTHLNELQKENGKLYVHTRWGTRGGIDLTFGDGSFYGGILIRGIKYKDEYIPGPARSRDFIVDKLNEEKKLTINSSKELQKIFNKKNSFKLVQNVSQTNSIIHSTRVGLSDKSSDFKNALYRFIREDYLNEPKKANEKTKAIAISYFTLDYRYKYNEKSAIENIKNDKYMFNKLKDFKK